MTIKSKMTSYGLVEIVDAGTSPRYRLYVAGSLMKQSDDLSAIMWEFDHSYC
ncbi:MAG: hypothetical protein U0K60_11825 [Parafannyhessea umbonata]|jgi:hypothetical protein|nr:hypothetical protein [Parafannyhessea umbonata]